MNILALTRGKSACDYHRITLPMQFLPKADDDTYSFAYGPEETLLKASTTMKNMDIVFFNRVPDYEWKHLTMFRKKFGYKLVMDIDDHWDLYIKHIHNEAYMKANMGKRLIECMQESDFIFTTNNQLANEIRRYNSNLAVIPNAFPFGRRQFTEDPGMKMNKISFIYAGGTSHYWDLKSLDGVWTRIKSEIKIKDNAILILAGYHEETAYWKTAFNLMNNSGIVEKRPRRELQDYMAIYDGCHVSLAPLEKNKFNTFKSTIKIAEAGCKRMPIICSNQWPYIEDEIMRGKGLTFCDSTSDWIDAMKFYIDNPDKIQEHGNNLFEYVKSKYNLAEHNKVRYSIFKQLAQ